MSSPSLQYIWSGRVDGLLQNVSSAGYIGGSILMAIKQQLLGTITGGTDFQTNGGEREAVWTIEQSCDGSAVSTSSDLWGDDVTALVSGAYGSPHSWIVMKYVGPAHTLRMCLALNNAFNWYAGTISFSVDSAYTGGTTTLRPVATHEVMPGTLLAPSYSDTVQFSGSSAPSGGTWYSHFAINETNGSFHHVVAKQGAANVGHYLSCNLLEDATDDDDFPLVAICTYGDSDSTRMPNQLSSGGSTSLNSSGRVVSKYYDNSGVAQNGGLPFTQYVSTNFQSIPGADAITGKLYCQPVYYLNPDSPVQYRGKIPDMFLLGAPNQNGNFYPSSGQKKLCCVGALLLPFGATPTF